MMTHQELLRFFHANYPRLVSDMRNCDHAWSSDKLNSFHLEGTIFEHTMLVFYEAVRRGYDFETQLAALLHDIGKPYAMMRNKEKQKVTFYNHESESVFRSLQIMEDLKLPQPIRERLVKVIGLHTEVFKQPLQSLYELVGDLDTFFRLMELANCDHSGRFADLETPINYGQFLPEIKEPKPAQHKTKKVTVLVGMPYSGKSTEIKSLPDSFVISRDAFIETYPGKTYTEKWKNADQKQVDKNLQEFFKRAKNFNTVTIDMTHMSLKSRRKTLSHFGKDWQKDCIVLLPTLAEIEKRKLCRPEKVIDDSVLDAMMSSFRPPCLGEGFDNITYKF